MWKNLRQETNGNWGQETTPRAHICDRQNICLWEIWLVSLWIHFSYFARKEKKGLPCYCMCHLPQILNQTVIKLNMRQTLHHNTLNSIFNMNINDIQSWSLKIQLCWFFFFFSKHTVQYMQYSLYTSGEITHGLQTGNFLDIQQLNLWPSKWMQCLT